MFMKLLDALSRRVSESPLRALAALILLAIALVWAVSFLDRDHTRPVSTMPATDVANGVHTQQNLSDEDVRRVLETSREFHRRFSHLRDKTPRQKRQFVRLRLKGLAISSVKTAP